MFCILTYLYPPVLFLYVDGFSRLDVVTIVIAGALCHGYAHASVILVKAFGAGAAVHRQEVGGAAGAVRPKGSACLLALLQLVGERLGGGASLGVPA